MLSSHHNIRRPAFWLVLTCLGAGAFFVLTDPHMGLISYAGVNPIDAANETRVGTIVGLAGSGLMLLVALFLCTRKGSPPTMEVGKGK